MNIGIVGLGLIGASIAKSLKKRTSDKIFVCDSDSEVMQKASILSLYDEILTFDNASQLDILVFCTYPNTTIKLLDEYAPLLSKGTIVVDCGGTKRAIVSKMTALKDKYPTLDFVGGHPMAGREWSGISHSTASLFEKASVLIVPIQNDIRVLYKVKEFFLSIGAERVVLTTPDKHDEMISYTSQLAHIVSNAYVKSDLAPSHYGYSAGSFRDMTRVAKTNAKMWSELMLENADYLVEQLEVFEKNILDIKNALKNADKNQLESLLQQGNDIKEKVEENRLKKLNETGFQGE